MTRLCVIGNSHVAAYKLGWDALAAAGDDTCSTLTPTFFGAPRDGVRHIEREGEYIVPTRKDVAESFARLSNGREQIGLAEYDAFLLVGLNVSIKRILRFYKTHFWYDLKSDQRRTMVPAHFAQEFLTERYSNTLLVETAAKLRAGTNSPIIAVAEPFWASSVRQDIGKAKDYGWESVIQNGDSQRLSAMFQKAITLSLKDIAIFVSQAPETIEDGIMTSSDFNKEASKLISGEGGATDAAHMNGKFGQVMWKRVAREILDFGLSADASVSNNCPPRAASATD